MSDDDSSEAEDVDYAPTTKEIKEAEGEEQRAKKQRLTEVDGVGTQKAARGSSAVDEIWQRLRASGSDSSQRRGINFGNLSKPAKKGNVPAADREWMRQLGIKPKLGAPAAEGATVSGTTVAAESADLEPSTSGGPEQVPEKARPTLDTSVAAKALAAAKSAMSSTGAQMAGQVSVLETRRFAGKDVQIRKVATSEEAEKLESREQERKKAGLDAVLASLESAKKVSVLDKSRDDWGSFKDKDTRVAEELEAYKKSGGKYLDKVQFLKRAEMREYEAERDQRLARESRTRGRT